MKQLHFHKLADLFPLMEGDAFDAFAADIKERGLLHPIVVLDDKILDGRNRYRACLKADVAVRLERFVGDDPLGFVIASNLHRRHLDESQRAMVAAKLATLPKGRPGKNAENSALSQNGAAELLNVDRRTVQHAAAVRANGSAALVQAVEQGAIPVSVAAKVAKLPKEQQREAVLDPDRAKHLVKRLARDDRERDLAGATAEASRELGTKVYGVIYADPPWRFKPYSEETGSDRAADNHYPTMTIDDIAEIEPPAATDCALFLWVTVPMLALGIKLMQRWGFEYKSACAWHKPAIGTGYWFRNQLELLLVGTRGSVPAPAMGYQPSQVQTLERGKHSEKPDAFADMIATMFPNTPKLEMFARHTRDGWDAWGNQVR
jgi:N6-adenosine-specific RNA methylase IME4